MRHKLWEFVVSKHPQWLILPWWMLAIRAFLFPLDFFYWCMGRSTGYDARNNTWNIHGVRYSDPALRLLANANGETYKITRSGDCVILECISA